MRLDVKRSLLLAVSLRQREIEPIITSALTAAEAAGVPAFLSCIDIPPTDLAGTAQTVCRSGDDIWSGDLPDRLRYTERDQLVIAGERFDGVLQLAGLGALGEAWEVSLLIDVKNADWSTDLYLQRLLLAGANPVTLEQVKLEWSLPAMGPPELGEPLFVD